MSGKLKANLTSFDEYRMIKRDLGQADDIVDIIDPRGIPTGKNNPIIEDVHFEFGQISNDVSYLKLGDDKKKRFTPLGVKNPKAQQTMRLEMSGIQIESAPFGFKFVDHTNHSNILLHTEQSNFFMSDKYL